MAIIFKRLIVEMRNENKPLGQSNVPTRHLLLGQFYDLIHEKFL